jgi:hypothetical protein
MEKNSLIDGKQYLYQIPIKRSDYVTYFMAGSALAGSLLFVVILKTFSEHPEIALPLLGIIIIFNIFLLNAFSEKIIIETSLREIALETRVFFLKHIIRRFYFEDIKEIALSSEIRIDKAGKETLYFFIKFTTGLLKPYNEIILDEEAFFLRPDMDRQYYFSPELSRIRDFGLKLCSMIGLKEMIYDPKIPEEERKQPQAISLSDVLPGISGNSV